jgi:hypothetical protein
MSSGASGPPNRLRRHPSGGETFHGPIELITLGDWDWVLGVELMSNKNASAPVVNRLLNVGRRHQAYSVAKRQQLA